MSLKGRWTALIALAVLAFACAKIEPPPGGPPDNTPPQLIEVRPDSLAIYSDFHGSVEFRFDEVISEGGQSSQGLGTSDLERLIILSPTTAVPKVSWKRTAISVEPREGWKPNRVYRVELLPGVLDLRRNRLDSGTVVTFSTGASLPDARLTGTIVDWAGGRLATAALVEAILLPDSLPYRSLTDSSGHFDLGPLPRGQYLLYGVLDQSHNFRRESREGWDSTRVTTDSAAPPVLWAALRDTVGPKLTTLTPVDSIRAELTFNQPVDPYQHFDSSNVRVFAAAADSAVIPVLSLLPKAIDDSLQLLAARQAADTIRRDTTTQVPADSARERVLGQMKRPPAQTQDTVAQSILRLRPKLSDRLVLRVTQALQPGGKYIVQVFGIRSLNGVAADSRQLLNVPEPPPPQPDSLKPATPDSTRTDSTPPSPPRPR